MTGTTVVLFTRDLRVHDHPALAAACRESAYVVPLFVLDARILDSPTASPNRGAFLTDALADLRGALRGLGGDLVLRSGDVVAEAVSLAREVGARCIVASADVSAYARGREHRLATACAAAGLEFGTYPGVTVVPPDALHPATGDHYRIFTPYWRAWSASRWRQVEPAPGTIRFPSGLRVGSLPGRGDLVRGKPSPDLPRGGEKAGLARLDTVVRRVGRGEPDRDDLAGDHTTRLSPYLHLGCVSPLLVAERLRDRADGLVRQLCWRDFHHQVTYAFPEIATKDYREGRRTWEDPGSDAVDAWREGRTGVPLVDAGMRQLLAEGWMHNRARMVTASFLTKQLNVDWRVGAAHFSHWLVDGDLAVNSGNWQWVAGTGNDTRPNRVLSPTRQAQRFDPRGAYIRRYVPELAGVDDLFAREPWRMPEDDRRKLDYPPPVVDPTPGRARVAAGDGRQGGLW